MSLAFTSYIKSVTLFISYIHVLRLQMGHMGNFLDREIQVKVLKCSIGKMFNFYEVSCIAVQNHTGWRPVVAVFVLLGQLRICCVKDLAIL